jgi:hypothetical protein
VLAPGSTDVIFVFPDQSLGRPNLAVVQAVILRQFNLRLKPELRFPVRVVHVDVKAGFLAREEKEPESVLAKDCRAQGLLFPATIALSGPKQVDEGRLRRVRL